MPTLNWIGKEAVVNHHQQVPFHLLKDVPELACGKPGEGNLIVQGDNLVALKALLPYYAGQVKCIYIDPPYNTGNESWVYNDNVSSPVIREWLGKVVGKEGETLDRHDRWLCMMYPRLVLLKQFLREDGAIFVSIDDNEAASLRFLMDEIFGTNNLLCAFAWEKRYSPPPDTKDIGYLHETLLAYRRSQKFTRNLLTLTGDQTGRYKNPDNDPRGPWKSMDYTCRYTADERPNLYYPIRQLNTGDEIWPKRTRVWAMSKDTHECNVAENRIWWGAKGTNSVPALKNFLSEIQQGMMPVSLLKHDVVGHTDEAAKELRALVPELKFTPKPTRLIRHLLQIATDKDSLILDSFAGSGTTGHAVLKQNAEDGGNRRFILVEMDEHIARNVTAERVRRVAASYTNAKGEHVEGLGGGFRYCELGEPLFDEHGKIRDSVRFTDLARHVYFTETGEPLPRERVSKSALLGDCRGVGIYLLYNGILGDKSANGGNVLTRAVLAQLPPFDGPKVIYCVGCLLGRDRLRAENIIVRQTPYEIKVS
ncbi:MAG: site-specific DNA-methyltransferase [Nitrosomonadales bacterium]|nr:site-specific DNA-methyltransferase [Nitrosomonadales bacterium]